MNHIRNFNEYKTYLPIEPLFNQNNIKLFYLPDINAIKLFVKQYPKAKHFFNQFLDNDPNVDSYWETYTEQSGAPFVLINDDDYYVFQYSDDGSFGGFDIDNELVSATEIQDILWEVDLKFDDILKLKDKIENWDEVSSFFSNINL